MGVGKSTFAFTNTAITLDGESTTINITRDNQSYSHKLSHGHGTIATLAVGTTSYTWKPTAAQLTEFFNEVPNQKTRQIDIYLDTYNGSTLVGRDIHALTVTLLEATGKPTFTIFDIDDRTSITNDWGVFVRGLSELNDTVICSGKYGATVDKPVYVYDDKEYYFLDLYIASLPLTTTPKEYTLECKITDSRGFTNVATLKKQCAMYISPVINKFEAIRCDTDGNETVSGTKVKVTIQGSWASIGGKNAASFKFGYKVQNADSYTYVPITVTDGVVDYEAVLDPTFSTDLDYYFCYELKDSLFSVKDSGIGFLNDNSVITISPDGSSIVIGSTGANNVLVGKDGVKIRDSEKVGAEFKQNKLSFCEDSMEIGYDQTASGLGCYLKSVSGNRISLIAPTPNEEEVETEGHNALLTMYGGMGSSFSAVNIEAGNIRLKPTNTLTYDMPVNMYGDCNDLINSGKYHLGNNSANIPVNKNGWLESKLYSTDYCHQTYTTYDGEIYVRTMQAKSWGAWSNSTIKTTLSGDNRLLILGPLRIIQGSWSFAGVGKEYQKLCTLEQLKQRFGLTSINSSNVYINVMNGDASQNGLTLMGVQYWVNDGYYVYFSGTLGSGVWMRINYVYIYLDL